jgi:hypothetical protein
MNANSRTKGTKDEYKTIGARKTPQPSHVLLTQPKPTLKTIAVDDRPNSEPNILLLILPTIDAPEIYRPWLRQIKRGNKLIHTAYL